MGYPTSRRVPPLVGGLVALLIPGLLIAIAVRVGFGIHDDVATAFLATLLVGLAAPIAWLFAIDFIDASPLTVLVIGTVSSFPLWYLLGAALANRSSSVANFANRYTAFIGMYLAAVFAIIAIADAIANA